MPSKPSPASRRLSARTLSIAARAASGSWRDRDLRGHAAHRVRAAAVAGLDQQLGVGAHERHRHRHVVAVREHELPPVPEALDHREDVVPAPGVEAGRVVAQLVQDLVHLERRGHGLDQDRGADRAAVHAEPLLRQLEGRIPQPRLAVTLELGQVQVGPGAALEQARGLVGHEEAEVEQPAGHGPAVDQDVAVVQVPAARADQQRGDLVLQRVLTIALDVLDGALDRVDEVEVPADDVGPGRRAGVLEVGHPAAGAGVERVDRQLALRRPRDLDAPVAQVLRRGGDRPLALAQLGGRRGEVERLAGGQARHPLAPPREAGLALGAQLALKLGHERERVRREDLVEALLLRGADLESLDARRHRHGSSRRRGRGDRVGQLVVLSAASAASSRARSRSALACSSRPACGRAHPQATS